MSEKEKCALVPRLRFPEFREAAEWGSEKLEQLITTVSPPSKLQSSSYRMQGKFPIIDQSQELICGWTDDESAVITESLPLIVFGDHTCALKFVDKPFAQGADGIKILKAKSAISAEYLFHSLSHRPLAMEDYKRHFSILKEREVVFPNIKSGEQQKIADCLSSLDELITAETRKLDTLKAHKKGLMQQLFPREGETVPHLRFPEFLEAGEWKIKSLGTVCTVLQGYGFPETLQGRTEGQYPFCKVSDVSRSVAENGGFLAKAANYVNANDLATLRAKLIPIGATVFAKIGEALRLNRRAFVQCECLIDNNAVGLKAVPGVANDYFIYLLSQLIDLNDHCGGAVPSVNKSTLEAIEVVVPEVDEQEKIAASMSYHDELIRNQEKKIDILKIHKTGLMQQLFPVLNGEQA
ncbi:MAG: restriction endonuclease subunit S [Gammaproteobacteria bacterium]|jgi:type I restriction enzyme S subunit|nr:restriction endonuclease subunit S [Gammaproteobacteria bacterium]